MSLAFIQGIGPTELIIVLVIVLVIFGPKRLPSLARSLGGGIKEFKESVTSKADSDEDDDAPRRWHSGIDFDGSWVVFADAGRGWLVGDRRAELVYPRGSVPSFNTFLTDIGVGLDFGERGWGDPGTIGIYVAKSISRPSQPANVLLRVRRRF